MVESTMVILGSLTIQLWAMSDLLQLWFVAVGICFILLAAVSLYFGIDRWHAAIRLSIQAAIFVAIARTHDGVFNRTRD